MGGQQLLELVDMLRNETGRSSNMAVGVDETPQLKQILRRTQTMLYRRWDWPHLKVRPTVALRQGERFYDPPVDLDYDRIEKVYAWWNALPIPIERGIYLEDFALYDSEKDERSDPVLKWDVVFRETREQVEVWPIPAQDGSRLQFVGIRKLARLVDDSDRCDLDGDMIVLYAAADLLAEKEAKRAEIKRAAAQSIYDTLTAGSKGGERIRRNGLGARHPYLSGKPVIVVSSGS